MRYLLTILFIGNVIAQTTPEEDLLWASLDSLEYVTSWGDTVYRWQGNIVYKPKQTDDYKWLLINYTAFPDTVTYRLYVWIGDDLGSKIYEFYWIWRDQSDTLTYMLARIPIVVNRNYLQLKLEEYFHGSGGTNTIFSKIIRREELADFTYAHTVRLWK